MSGEDKINEQWKSYRKHFYPDGLGSDQHAQVKQAFFSGMIGLLFCLAETVNEDLPQEEVQKNYNELLNAVKDAITSLM